MMATCIRTQVPHRTASRGVGLEETEEAVGVDTWTARKRRPMTERNPERRITQHSNNSNNSINSRRKCARHFHPAPTPWLDQPFKPHQLLQLHHHFLIR
jgi:hypothetical protein